MSGISFRLTEDSPMGKVGDLIRLDGNVATVNGKHIGLALAPSDVHVPSEMPTYLAGYRNAEFRADEMSQVIPTGKTSDYYRTFDQDDAFQHVNVKGSLEGSIPEVSPRSSAVKYETVHKFLGTFLSDYTEQNASGSAYRPRQVAARNLARFLMLDREIDVATMLTTAGNWGSSSFYTTLGATAKWNGGSASDPIADIQARSEASAQEPTDVWFNRKVANAFLRHPAVRDQMRQMLGDRGADNIAAALDNQKPGARLDFSLPGLPTFHVVAAKRKNATTGVLEYVMSDDTVLTVRPPGVPMDGEDIATSYTFRFTGDQGVGFQTREFRVEGRGVGGTMIVAQVSDVPVFTGTNCGGLIKACVQ